MLHDNHTYQVEVVHPRGINVDGGRRRNGGVLDVREHEVGAGFRGGVRGGGLVGQDVVSTVQREVQG